MKHIININLSKDTPAETLTELYAVIKAQGEKPKRKQPLYALNEDIEQLHARYEVLFKQVKNSLNLSENQIKLECETLSRKYEFELEELSKIRKLEYDKRQAEIEARENEQIPWRRGWWWRLLFRPLTNRAQDIIEARAEIEADKLFSSEENAIEEERKRLPTKRDKKRLKRSMRKELKKIIESADNADVQEVLTEPSATSEPPEPPTRKSRKDKKSEG